jgi:cyclopropane-fatty-acyl-phospholipid synthase
MATAMHSFVDGMAAKLIGSCLDRLFSTCANRDFSVQLWDGSRWGADRRRFALILNRPAALRALFDEPDEVKLGTAYVNGDIDIDGDIEAACELGEYISTQQPHESLRLSALRFLCSLKGTEAIPGPQLQGQLHSRNRDRQAVSYHYDLPVPFYALWLDEHMVYSCAYFLRETDNIDTAQAQKLDYICQKLRLRPGDSVLDIGCGWGGLVLHAAKNYGVNAVGITLSARQADFTRKRFHELGLDHRCRVEICDYRDVEQPQGFDKILSVGMFEHVGKTLLPEYFKAAFQLLRPGGTFLNHGISCSATNRQSGPSFSDRFVFPDGELVPIGMAIQTAEQEGFELRDIESLREHYLLTLRQWLKRLENNSCEAKGVVDEKTYRIWRLYLAGAARRFEIGRLNVYQALFVKPTGSKSGLPLTRQDWYETTLT